MDEGGEVARLQNGELLYFHGLRGQTRTSETNLAVVELYEYNINVGFIHDRITSFIELQIISCKKIFMQSYKLFQLFTSCGVNQIFAFLHTVVTTRVIVRHTIYERISSTAH